MTEFAIDSKPVDREGILRALRDSAGRRFYDLDAVEHFAAERDRRVERSS